MAIYRFTGGMMKARQAEAQQCCEPVCGPSTCGASAEAVARVTEEKGTAKGECS